jgi:signal transduction histidine kinase
VRACNNLAQQWAASEFGVDVRPGFAVETENAGLGELLKAAGAVLAGKLNDFETTYIDNDENNSVSYFQVQINPVYDNHSNRIGVQLAARDITVTKQAEYDRARIIEDLVRHNKDLEQFNYIVTHNLRSPAANIVGLTTLLRKETPGTPEFDRCVELLLQASKKLDSVTHDLNSILNKKKSISEIKEFVNLGDVVEDIKVGISEMIIKENATIEYDFTQVSEIQAVKSYVHSIFHNLISNSIKYRSPDRSPVISVRAYRQADHITIRIKDNGLGIDLKNHGHEVFGLYRRFHAHGEGKGMGLFMVKTQVESLGGKISVQSVPEGGTEFVIVF